MNRFVTEAVRLADTLEIIRYGIALQLSGIFSLEANVEAVCS